MPSDIAAPAAQIQHASIGVLERQINRGLMIGWINDDLINRASHDIDHSIVLYDQDKMFVHALPRDFTDEQIVKAAEMITGARYWTRGC